MRIGQVVLVVVGSMCCGFLPTHGAAQAPDSLSLEVVTVLRDPTGEAGLVMSASPQRHPTGRYVMADALERSRLSIFDSEGRFLRHVGRRGGGPGEYDGIQHVSVQSDGSVYVYDMGNGRVSVLSPEFELRETRPIHVPMLYSLRFPGDTFVVTNAVAVGTGESVVIVDENGDRVRPLGPPRNPEVQTPTPLLSRAGEREVWLLHPWRYELELYNLDGAHLRTIRRNASWFPRSPEPPPRYSPSQPPLPFVLALRRRQDGALAVLTCVAAEGWRSAIRESPWGSWTTDDPAALWDTILELIDEETGQVIASARFSEYLSDFADDDLVYSYVEDAVGNPRIDIYRFRRMGR